MLLEEAIQKVPLLINEMPNELEQKLGWHASCLGWQAVAPASGEIPSNVKPVVNAWQRDIQKCKQELENFLNAVMFQVNDQVKRDAVDLELQNVLKLYVVAWEGQD